VPDILRRALIVVGALYLRHTPFKKGRYRITTLLLSWLRALGPTMGWRTIRTRYGFRFHADLADWLGQYVYLTGTYEPPTSDQFRKLVNPGDTVLDVGANAGYFSLLSATLAGPNGRVIAFEPIPTVRNALSANVQLNRFSNIRVVPKAVSDVPARLTIYEGPEGHKGISSLRPLASASREVVIDAVALDDLISDLGRVDCIKIDVEGAEMRALLGMTKLIERDSPSLIIEFTDEYLKSFGHSARQMAEWLAARGYRLDRIEEDGLIPLTPSDADLPPQYNVRAVHASRAEAVDKSYTVSLP
jgi:FkbM family methyltransferase